jgi:hypothetical protein
MRIEGANADTRSPGDGVGVDVSEPPIREHLGASGEQARPSGPTPSSGGFRFRYLYRIIFGHL